jgi:Ser/Thr protein kinase RdoA (MazF antagonist)
MFTGLDLTNILREWESVLGSTPAVCLHSSGRELWLVRSNANKIYYLKRLGPWRNLPLEDEARILDHLRKRGVPVAEFVKTDQQILHAGAVEDSFVLIPHLESAEFSADELLRLEPTIGAAVAHLHRQLATYPGSANSYDETVLDSLHGSLNLPDDLARKLQEARNVPGKIPPELPRQLIHGDMTPENIILRKPGEVSGFIDFEHLPIGPRIWDVAKYSSRGLRTRWLGEHPQAYRHNPLKHVSAFLRGYHGVNQLHQSEQVALPAAILVGNLVEASYFRDVASGKIPRRQLPDHFDVLEDTVRAAAWHLDHYELVCEAVESAFQ